MNFDFNVDSMSVDELRELSRRLIRIVKSDAEIIHILRNIIENQQGE